MTGPSVGPALATALAALLVSCGGGPSAYDRALGRATEAERKHDTSGARGALEAAAKDAPNERARDEALYRWAALAKQDGDPAAAGQALLDFVASHPNAERAPRALLDAGRAFERGPLPERARAAYLQLVEKYPASGGALSGAARYVALSPAPASAAWQELIALNRDPELDAGLRYNAARELEPTDPRAALAAYEDVARRDPLPQGTHSDEALLRAAELRRKLGDPEGALRTLDVLLEARSFSYMAGSYERAAFAQARMLQGLIQRDDLERFAEAARSFERLVTDHPQSRLVDDALFAAAWSWARAADREHACSDLGRLSRERPDSIWAACGALYCVGETTPLDGRCCKPFTDDARPDACK